MTRSSHNAKKKTRYISLSGNLKIPDVCIQFELIYFVFYSIESSSHTEEKVLHAYKTIEHVTIDSISEIMQEILAAHHLSNAICSVFRGDSLWSLCPSYV